MLLAPAPSRLARARSGALRQLATRTLPTSVLFARGSQGQARKRVALTFDDGPDALTPLYLDVLARLGVRATFFVIGENVAREPGLLRAIELRGHAVAAHGWTHQAF